MSPSLPKILRHLSARDPQLSSLVYRYRNAISIKREPGFKTLIRIIISQQLSGKAAKTIFNRIVSEIHDGEINPLSIIGLGSNKVRNAGVSEAKSKFVMNLAETLLSSPSLLDQIADLPDEEAKARLCSINGIGPWTAAIYLISGEGRLNIFPEGDGTLKRAIERLYIDRGPYSKSLEGELVEQWSPYRTVACRLLWRWVDDGFKTSIN